MNFLKVEYFEQLIDGGNKSLSAAFNFSETNYSSFQIANTHIINEFFSKEKANLLISLPKGNKIEPQFYPLILLPLLKCFSINAEIEHKVSIDDVIIEMHSGDISHVKMIRENQLSILKVLTTNRTELNPGSPFLILSAAIKNKIGEIKKKDTQLKREKGIEHLKTKLLEDIKKYQKIFSYFNSMDKTIPVNNKNKVIVIAPKTDFLITIPDSIPYEYINKSGITTDCTSFEPLLYVVNDFDTAKDYIIEKGVEIDTIIFIGHNKYKSLSPVSKLYRQGKFNRCIFIGTEDVESSDNFKVLKWNWTLSEIKYFSKVPDRKINAVTVPHPELSNEISNYARIVEDIETQNDNLVNLKPLLKFIRKIYPVAAFNNEQRIKAGANIIVEQFKKDADEFFQEEYASIDKESENDFFILKKCFEKIVELVKKSNAKANWFKDSSETIDYIVVPNMQKNEWEREIKNCVQDRPIGARVKNFADLNNVLQTKVNQNTFIGLKGANVITLREFENKVADNKCYLFISLYGYNVYPDTLLEKIYAKNVTSNVLLYPEENKAFQFYLQRFYDNSIKEFQSADREELCDLKYSKIPDTSSLNLDDWIKHLIEFDNFKSFRSDDFKYEIVFEENTKPIKKRESLSVFVEGTEDNSKEICELKKGDKVRIYENPDKETLHDIIKMTDEKEIFIRVDYLSAFWKTKLKDYYIKNCLSNIIRLYEELKKNGLTIEKNNVENWLKVDNKTKFPKKNIDMLAIIKTVNHPDLKEQIQPIIALKKEYSGRLNQAGLKFSEEINNYILIKEKGKMLDLLSDNHIEKIIDDGAPLRTIKSIKKIDYEISN